MKKLITAIAILSLCGCSYFTGTSIGEKSDTSVVPGQTTLKMELASAEFSNSKHLPLTLGFGSGAYHRPGDPANVFYTVTDRGPNISCSDSEKLLGQKDFCAEGDDNDKIFPLADFTPLIVKHEIQMQDGKPIVTQLESITLKDSAGKNISGLTNELKAAKTEKSFGNNGKILPWDNSGIDPEAIVRLKDDTYWLSEEYGPSLLHVAQDGTILQRVVPESVAADLKDAGYPVKGLLPDVYKNRKLNRGIESLAVSPNEDYLYFIMQSPLANPDSDTYKSSRTVRLMKYALKNGELGKPLGEYTYVMDTPQTFCDLTSQPAKGDQKNGLARSQSDVKISEMVAVGEDDLIVLERISQITKLYRVHLSTGDNILGTQVSNKGQEEAGALKTLEQIWDLSSVKAAPVQKIIVYNSLTEQPAGLTLPSKVEGLALLDDQQVLLINDNDFGIDGQQTVATVLPIAKQLTSAETKADKKPQMTLIGRHSSGLFDQGGSEIVAYHVESKRIFVINAEEKTVDILDAGHLTSQELADSYSTINIKKLASIPVSKAGSDKQLGSANSLSIVGNLLAVAVEAADDKGNKKQGRGIVAFYDIAKEPRFIKSVEVGYLPDMVKITPDGSKVLVANEGEPNPKYDVDPVGSISVIAIEDGKPADQAIDLSFENIPIDGDIRIFGPTRGISQNIEPEYITVSKDSKQAWVALQENNALAVLDLTKPAIAKIVGLGLKDYGQPGNELDVSDKDDKIDLKTYDGLYGMYQPDSIACFSYNGANYLVTANEGDARDYWFDAKDEKECKEMGGLEFDEDDGCLAYSEESRIAKLKLNPKHPSYAAASDKKALGRMVTTVENGDTDADGKIDKIYTFGARSFSIWNQDGKLIFDSMADFEKITAGRLGENFNTTNTENKGDNRSDDKGAEPEAITVGNVNGRTLAFIGLERTGGIMMYDVTSPYAPQFLQYTSNRNFDVSIEDQLDQAGDLAPEGMQFVSAENSPTSNALLIVGNEVSGSTAVYEIQ